MCFLESAFAFSMAFCVGCCCDPRTTVLAILPPPLLIRGENVFEKILDTRIQRCLRGGGGGGCMDGHVCGCAILRVSRALGSPKKGSNEQYTLLFIIFFRF